MPFPSQFLKTGLAAHEKALGHLIDNRTVDHSAVTPSGILLDWNLAMWAPRGSLNQIARYVSKANELSFEIHLIHLGHVYMAIWSFGREKMAAAQNNDRGAFQVNLTKGLWVQAYQPYGLAYWSKIDNILMTRPRRRDSNIDDHTEACLGSVVNMEDDCRVLHKALGSYRDADRTRRNLGCTVHKARSTSCRIVNGHIGSILVKQSPGNGEKTNATCSLHTCDSRNHSHYHGTL